jgi:hypothetical protein
LVIDEAARVSDELYYTVRPMLAVSGGAIVAMSTPFGKRGRWFREWAEGGPDWKRVRITADQCPRISPKFLEEERRSMGNWWFQQEYGGEFMEDTDSVFPYELIMKALQTEATPLFGGA